MEKLKRLADGPGIQNATEKIRAFVIGDGEDYEQFETRTSDSETIIFRDNDKQFRLFGTNIHVKIGAYIACVIGFMVTVAYCIEYTFYHSRGMGRNEFIDQIELVDLIFAFVLGLPCHGFLLYGIYNEKKNFFAPYLIFYATNFILNIIFMVLTIIAAIFDLHKLLFGNVRFDIGWLVFQLCFTLSQGLAMFVVLKGRRYAAARDHFQKRLYENRRDTIVADSV